MCFTSQKKNLRFFKRKISPASWCESRLRLRAEAAQLNDRLLVFLSGGKGSESGLRTKCSVFGWVRFFCFFWTPILDWPHPHQEIWADDGRFTNTAGGDFAGKTWKYKRQGNTTEINETNSIGDNSKNSCSTGHIVGWLVVSLCLHLWDDLPHLV